MNTPFKQLSQSQIDALGLINMGEVKSAGRYWNKVRRPTLNTLIRYGLVSVVSIGECVQKATLTPEGEMFFEAIGEIQNAKRGGPQAKTMDWKKVWEAYHRIKSNAGDT